VPTERAKHGLHDSLAGTNFRPALPRFLQIAGLVGMLAGLLLVLSRCGGEKWAAKVPGEAGEENAGQKTQDRRASALQPAGAEGAAQKLERALAQLRRLSQAATGDEDRVLALLRKTQDDIFSLPAREAAGAILDQLKTRVDAATGLGFVPGEEGLDRWPTWRVYLLDLLGSLQPKMAADYARREIFPRHDSADEWALGMRSVLAATPSQGQLQAQAELSELLSRMMFEEHWRAQPSEGMLEAMDFVAHTGNPATHLDALARWAAEKNDGSIDLAVQVAAERTAERQGDRVLSAVATNPNVMSAMPLQRAALMARADLRQPEQVAALQNYLACLAPESAEAEAFFSLFPNHRFSVAPGLSGSPVLPGAGEMRAADTAAAAQLAAWRSDPDLAIHAAALDGLQVKLSRLLR